MVLGWESETILPTRPGILRVRGAERGQNGGDGDDLEVHNEEIRLEVRF